jgi:DNA invertase Pin-like site-specific DNA recombinase
LRVALYCRVVGDRQAGAGQEHALRAWAERAGHAVVEVCLDCAPKGEGRPLRDRVLGLAQAGEIDAVLVPRLTRWSSSTGDLLATLRKLHSLGVSLSALHGPSPGLPGQGFANALPALLAAFERDLLSERRGGWVGRYVVRYPLSDRPAPQAPPWLAADRRSGGDGCRPSDEREQRRWYVRRRRSHRP